jgi:release factor glutamine methyltransferase
MSAAAPITVGRLLAASGLPLSEARALLAHLLAVPRERLVAWPDQQVAAADAARFDALAQRRRDGEPLAYLLGEREFFGRPFRVTPAVLVPRPETELLVEAALAALHRLPADQKLQVLDLGTGSGCIAISIALGCPQAVVTAVDASADALTVAADNARRLGASVLWRRGDWYAGLQQRFELIVSNPPYIAPGDPHLPALTFEPVSALVGDDFDGLGCLRRIIDGARVHLAEGGWLMVEHGHDQGAGVRAQFAAAGCDEVRTLRDAAGIERVCLGRQPRAAP